VDDSELVGEVTRRMLANLGYEVLAASDAEGCMEIVKTFAGEIHLLLTDVIMPRVNGRALYEAVHRLRPRLKVVYMSGYTDDEIGRHGVLDENTLLIVKPFSVTDLGAMIRRALDS